MALVDDWTLLQSGSLLGGEMVADESQNESEFLKRYQALTGIDIFSDKVQDYKKGGLEQLRALGLSTVVRSDYKQQVTKENLAKLGYTAPLIDQAEVIRRSLSGGEYADYKKQIDASNKGLTANDNKAYTDRYNALSAEVESFGNSYSSVSNFQQRNPGISVIQNPYTGFGFMLDSKYDPIGNANPFTDANAKALGVTFEKGQTAKSTTEYYTEKYGTEFSQEQIDSALTGKYGEIQGANDMGQGWKDLYLQYDKWKKQDDMWYDTVAQLDPAAHSEKVANKKAEMSAGGLKYGSGQWNSTLQNIIDERTNYQDVYQQKQDELKGSSLYKSLENQFNELKGANEMRGIQQTETRYREVLKFNEAVEKYRGTVYGRDSETGNQIVISEGGWYTQPAYNSVEKQPYEYTFTKGTETGRLLYGQGDEKLIDPTMDEFYKSQFGEAQNVENPYINVGVSNQTESPEDKRARLSASGVSLEQV